MRSVRRRRTEHICRRRVSEALTQTRPEKGAETAAQPGERAASNVTVGPRVWLRLNVNLMSRHRYHEVGSAIYQQQYQNQCCNRHMAKVIKLIYADAHK